MDTEAHPESEFPNMDNTSFASNGGTFFAGSQGFTINNSIFNSVTHVATSDAPPAIHTITMGDIELRSQLHADSDEWRFHEDTGIVHHERRRGCVRRVYSAKVGHHKADMTVVMFEGDSAEQEWQQNIATYSGLRHPNILQIYGVASSGGMHATLFHGDLMRLTQFLDLHEHSPILQVYLTGSIAEQFGGANTYFASRFGRPIVYGNCRVWIRPLTGLISLELAVEDWEDPWRWWSTDTMAMQNPAVIFNASNREAMAINCISPQVYHRTCYQHLSDFHLAYLSTSASVTLGAVVFWPHSYQLVTGGNSFTFEIQEDRIELAFVEHIEVDGSRWFGNDEGAVLANGWTRFPAHSLISYTTVYLKLGFGVRDRDMPGWLSQANHIFKRLQIKSGLCDYGLLHGITFEICLQAIVEATPAGYLFLCPPNHFRTGPASFAWPDCPVYWSLDFSGLERLSTEEAMHLGFPSFELKSRVYSIYWKDKIYASLRQFHAGKGFDPDSQDLARHLGHHLYRLSSDEPVDAETEVAEAAATTQTSDTDFFATSVASARDSEGHIQDGMPPVSRTSKLLMNLQLGLILFILIYQACEAIF